MSAARCLAAGLALLAPAALGAVAWGRARLGSRGTPSTVAFAWAGATTATIGLWLAASLLGMRSSALLAGAWLPGLVLGLDAWRGRPSAAPACAEARSSAGGSDASSLRTTLALAGLGAGLAVAVALCFLPQGRTRADGVHRLAMTDWYKHVIVATAIATTDAFPPANPFLATHDAPSYYFGFHLVAAAMARLAGRPPDVYPALLALTWGTALVAPFLVFEVARRAGSSARAALLAALAACWLVGFDVVVMALDAASTVVRHGLPEPSLAGLRALVPSTHLDYWIHHDERQLNPLLVALAWAPQHVVAALGAVLALVWLGPLEASPGTDGGGARPDGPRAARPPALLPALLIAALPALSAYVAVGLALGLSAALAVAVVGERQAPWRTDLVARWWAPGVAAVALALPVLSVLARGAHGSAAGAGGGAIAVHVSDAGGLTNGAIFSTVFGEQAWARLLDTPAVLLMELGVVACLAAVELRARRRHPDRRPSPVLVELTAAAVGIAVAVTFLRSPVGGPNNLYARPMLITLVGLAVLAGSALERLGWRRWVVAASLVGALGQTYAVVGMILEGTLFWASPRAEVAALRWVDDALPGDAVVAVHPDEVATPLGLFLRRRLAVGDERHARLLGAPEAAYRDARDRLATTWTVERPVDAWTALRSVGATWVVTGTPARAFDEACLPLAKRFDGWVVRRVAELCPAAHARDGSSAAELDPSQVERPGEPAAAVPATISPEGP